MDQPGLTVEVEEDIILWLRSCPWRCCSDYQRHSECKRWACREYHEVECVTTLLSWLRDLEQIPLVVWLTFPPFYRGDRRFPAALKLGTS